MPKFPERFFSTLQKKLFCGQPSSQAPSPQLCDNAALHAFLSKSSSSLLHCVSTVQSVTQCGWAGGSNGDQLECQASYIVQEYRDKC